MSNKKQDGSNIVNLEWSTGRCPVFCEQCFCNFGQNGAIVPHGIMEPRQQKWHAYARAHGWKSGRRDPSGIDLGLATDKSAQLIPTLPSAFARRRKETITGADGYAYPCFLRISSMSDSSLAPTAWCRDVHAVWGDWCFFNSTIRAVKRRPENLREAFHKVVVTVNGGQQSVPAMRPVSRVVKRYREQGKAAAERTLRALGYRRLGNYDTREEILNSMGSAVAKQADFLRPAFLGDIGLGEHEDRVKFYRMRACPTISGEIRTDRPVVITQMRFKSVAHACEFARRYKLGIEVMTDGNRVRKACAVFGVSTKPAGRWGGTKVRLWSKSHDNKSPYRGEDSEYFYASGFLRPMKDHFRDWPWVCDRAGGGCAECGLCASLDGTAGGDFSNPLNPIPARPYEAFYIADPSEAEHEEYFASLLGEATGGWYHNPIGETPERDEAWVELAIRDVAAYYTQSGDESGRYCEGWNTHEEAATTAAFCYWCLLRIARRQGLGREEALEQVEATIAEMARDTEVLGDTEELRAMWEDDSDWTEQFGSTESR